MIAFVNQYLFGVAVPCLLVLAGIYYAVYLRGLPLRHPLRLLRVLTERAPSDGVSPIRALSLALAGTLGVGNIVGVSAAIALGGFGAIFWMWVSALCAMLLKYAEIVLAVRHRRFSRDGSPYGGAPYYVRDCFALRRCPWLGRLLAGLFAVLCILNALTMGSAVQVRAVCEAMEGVFSIPPLVTATVLCAVCAAVLLLGSRAVLRLTDTLVPLMTLGYLVLSVAVLVLRADAVDDAFSRIVRDALTPAAGMGGLGGFLLSRALRYGTMRGLISNEAGCGTAPIAHASASCTMPAKQGVWGIVEVFTDTILLCTLTALVVTVSYGEVVAREGNYLMMTVDAYAAVLGDGAAIFMAVAVLLFGLATVVCWAHYGRACAAYLSERRWLCVLFSCLYCASVVWGSLAESALVWSLADLAVGAMTVINLWVLLLMRREVREETDRLCSSWRSVSRRAFSHAQAGSEAHADGRGSGDRGSGACR